MATKSKSKSTRTAKASMQDKVNAVYAKSKAAVTSPEVKKAAAFAGVCFSFGALVGIGATLGEKLVRAF